MNTICRFVKTHPDVQVDVRVIKEDVEGSAGVEISMCTTNDMKYFMREDRAFRMDKVCDSQMLEKILFEIYQILMDKKNGKPSNVVYRDC